MAVGAGASTVPCPAAHRPGPASARPLSPCACQPTACFPPLSAHRCRETETLDDKAKNVKSIYKLESSAKDGNAQIEAFVVEALEVYRKQQTAKVDHSRYLYMPVLNGFKPASTEEGEKNAPSAAYKRYKLSEEKTFASFFHPEKASILGLIEQFSRKQGKFSLPGYPQKVRGSKWQQERGDSKATATAVRCTNESTAPHDMGTAAPVKPIGARTSHRLCSPALLQKCAGTLQPRYTAHAPRPAQCTPRPAHPGARRPDPLQPCPYAPAPGAARLPAVWASWHRQDLVHQGPGAAHAPLHHLHPSQQNHDQPGADGHCV
jgi:hypothetical protein